MVLSYSEFFEAFILPALNRHPPVHKTTTFTTKLLPTTKFSDALPLIKIKTIKELY